MSKYKLRRRLPRYDKSFAILSFAILMSLNAFAQWQPAGRLSLPRHSYSFLTASPSGDIIAATFNSSALGKAPRNIPALLVRNPDSAKPENAGWLVFEA